MLSTLSLFNHVKGLGLQLRSSPLMTHCTNTVFMIVLLSTRHQIITYRCKINHLKTRIDKRKNYYRHMYDDFLRGNEVNPSIKSPKHELFPLSISRISHLY